MLGGTVFVDRVHAGQELAERLGALRGRDDVVVVGLPRGGVPVAAEVARALGAPLDVIVVRKLGVPFQPELGMGAIGEGGVRVLNQEILQVARVSPAEVDAIEQRERVELERRAQRFRAGRPHVPLAGKTVVIVDDGIATGSTAKAACQVARAHGAAKIVLAVPVAPDEAAEEFAGIADEFVCVATPYPFGAVGRFYRDFSQTTDDEVVDCLHSSPPPVKLPADPPAPRPRDEEVAIDVGGAVVEGHLTVPERTSGLVIFAHGSGSSRHSPRNREVAGMLNEAGIATLLFDLLTPAEERDRANVFDVELLADRLLAVTRWVRDEPDLARLPIGYFGASTGAAAALWAAAEPASGIAAVVSRGGRPDLAGPRLRSVTSPTLLIVGGDDHTVLDLNRRAAVELRCEHRITVVPGATHLFEEPGTLRLAATAARDWFTDHLRAASPATPSPATRSS